MIINPTIQTPIPFPVAPATATDDRNRLQHPIHRFEPEMSLKPKAIPEFSNLPNTPLQPKETHLQT